MSLVRAFRGVLAIAVVGVLCVGTAVAQQQGRGRGGPPGGGFTPSPGQEKLGYLANEAVQKALELADDQKADLKKVAEEAQTKGRELFAGAFQGGQNLSEEERNKRRDEMRQKGEALGKEMLKKVEAVLLPHQMDRLQEIWIQVRGASVLTDPEIAKQIGLSDKQTEQLTKIGDEIRQKMFQGGQGGQDRDAFRERFAALRKEREEKSSAVLSAAQKEKFEKMKGEPFDVEAANLRQGGGFGFGGQGGRPGQPGQGGQEGQPRRRPGGDGNNSGR